MYRYHNRRFMEFVSMVFIGNTGLPPEGYWIDYLGFLIILLNALVFDVQESLYQMT